MKRSLFYFNYHVKTQLASLWLKVNNRCPPHTSTHFRFSKFSKQMCFLETKLNQPNAVQTCANLGSICFSKRPTLHLGNLYQDGAHLTYLVT